MGSSSEYTCSSCGHSFISMGGMNIIMAGCTETHHCRDCGQIFERLIKKGDYDYEEGQPKDSPHCIHCQSTRIAPWTLTKGCIKCGEKLSATGLCCAAD